MAQETPTRINKGLPATEFTFRYARGAPDVVLSDNAQRLMNELREHAVKIKADMQAQREADGEEGAEGRKIAKPKSKVGRFSAAHMAEFKKMDSIENHASVWRANRTPPSAKPGIKRTHSKADLTETPIPKPSLKRTISKANLAGTPQSQTNPSLKRSSSRAKLDDGDSAQPDNVGFSVAGRPRTTPADVPQSSYAKRVKKLQDDDASKSRPMSRDGTSTPRLKSGQKTSNLPCPTSNTKPSTADLGTPSKAPRPRLMGKSPSPFKASRPRLVSQSPSKPDTGSLKKSTPMSHVASPSLSKAAELRRRIVSPGSFQKVKSILRGQKPNDEQGRTALPKPALQSSQTPGPSRVVDKDLPPLPPCPLTTPRRKLVKRVAFTPDTKHAAELQDSPSPQKFSMDKVAQPVQYPTMDGILSESTKGDVVYPDLSGLKNLTASPGEKKAVLQSVPGTFTFRSDHTIDFGSAPASGFGASPGQASLRHVRTSIGSKANMPGSFPAPPSPSAHPNKENDNPLSPKLLSSSAHGLPNKKRHRAPSEEGDVEQEADNRAAKKRKTQATPKGKTPSRPRPTVSTPFSSVKKLRTGGTPVPGSVSPTKKKGGISMSRLSMLARPKNRG